jgi:hypothetical protein
MHLLYSQEANQVPISLLIRGRTNLTVLLSALVRVLFESSLGLAHGFFYGRVMANMYLGAIDKKAILWNDMFLHLVVDYYSWKSKL